MNIEKVPYPYCCQRGEGVDAKRQSSYHAPLGSPLRFDLNSPLPLVPEGRLICGTIVDQARD